MSAWTVSLTARPPKRLLRLVLEFHDGRALGADSEEKHEPVSDIDTVVVDSLKVLDPKLPIREADIRGQGHTSCLATASRMKAFAPAAAHRTCTVWPSRFLCRRFRSKTTFRG